MSRAFKCWPAGDLENEDCVIFAITAREAAEIAAVQMHDDAEPITLAVFVAPVNGQAERFDVCLPLPSPYRVNAAQVLELMR